MKATAFAPATVANVGPGFDILGFAVEQRGDHVTVARRDALGISITIEGPGSHVIPTDPDKNTATCGLVALMRDRQLDGGLDVHLQKGIPIGSGLGGSAASAVGGIVAADAALGLSLTREEMLHYALLGEAVASGDAHPDNAAPCLWGGFTLAQELAGGEMIVRSLPTPSDLRVVLVHPNVRVDTRRAREVLPDAFGRADVVLQTANLARLLCGAFEGDWEAFADACQDVLVQPFRKALIPDFDRVREAALNKGALAFNISGSGPTMFALATEETAAQILKETVDIYHNVCKVESFISVLGAPGARIIR